MTRTSWFQLLGVGMQATGGLFDLLNPVEASAPEIVAYQYEAPNFSDPNAAFFSLLTEELVGALAPFGPIPKLVGSRGVPVIIPLRVCLHDDRIELHAMFGKKSKDNRLISTVIKTHSREGFTSDQPIIFTISLGMIKGLASLCPGAVIGFAYLPTVQTLAIRQGDFRTERSLYSGAQISAYQEACGEPLATSQIDPVQLAKALSFIRVLARADDGKEDSVSIRDGLAVGGGGNLLAVFYSIGLSNIDAALPLSALPSFLGGLRNFQADAVRWLTYKSHYAVTDGTLTVNCRAGDFVNPAYKTIISYPCDSNIRIPREVLLKTLTVLGIVLFRKDTSKSSQRMAHLLKPGAGQDQTAHDGKRAHLRISGEGNEAYLSLSIEQPSGRDKGFTRKPLQCQRTRAESYTGELQDLDIRVDLADWLCAVENTPGDLLKLSVSFRQGVPALIVVEAHGQDQVGLNIAGHRTRCFLNLQRPHGKKRDFCSKRAAI